MKNITLLCIGLVLCSCNSRQGSENTSPASGNEQSLNNDTVAKGSPGVKSIGEDEEIMIPNNKSIPVAVNSYLMDTTCVAFYLMPGDTGLYINSSRLLFIRDGRFGRVNPENLSIVETGYFKFSYECSGDEYLTGEMADVMSTAGVKPYHIIEKAKRGDVSGLELLFMHDTYMDGAAREIYRSFVWEVMNMYEDVVLVGYLKAVDEKAREKVLELLWDNIMVENRHSYLGLYYPGLDSMLRASGR